jgi:hypothetical protein
VQPIALRRLRSLDLARAPSPGRPKHLSAASALVLTGNAFHVVADDELHLGVFPVDGTVPGRLLRLFPGKLAAQRGARKRQKPDGESLVRLPAFGEYPHGALLALGSGSRPNRCRGALLRLDADGAVSGAAKAVDLDALYSRTGFEKLNIEGAYVAGSELVLLQRGGRSSPNARLRYPLAPILAGLASKALPDLRPAAIDRFDLGAIQAVPLGFTDAAPLPKGRMLFTAVAEDTRDSYHDGPCGAAALGIAAADGRIEFLGLLRPAWKVEGVAAWVSGGVIHLRLVTDADDPAQPALLLAGALELTW